MKKHFLMACLIVIVLTPFALSIRDNPHQSYTDFFVRGVHSSLTSIYSWSPESYGGNVAGSVWRFVPLSLIYFVFTNVLKFGSGITQFFVVGTFFVIGYLSYLKAVPKLLSNFDISDLAVKLTGLFYVFNTYTLIQFSNSFLLAIPYLLIPLQMYLLIKAFEANKFLKYIILLAFINGVYFGINLIFDVISFLILAGVAYAVVFGNKKISFKKICLFFIGVYALSLILCSFWLIPQIYSSLTDTKNTQYVLNSEQFYNSDSSILRVLRGLGDWSFFSGQNNVPYNSYASAYKNNLAVVISGYLFLALAISAVYQVGRNKRDQKSVITILTLLALVIVVIVGTYPGFPTSYIAQQAFTHIPFAKAFRNTYKFASIEMLLICLLSAISLSVLLKRIKEDRKWLTYPTAIFIVAVICVNAFPFFTNQLYAANSQIKAIPSYWNQATNYINKTVKNNGYIFMLPNQYFEALIWNGQFKSFPRNVEETLFKPPVVHNNCTGCGQYLTSNVLNFEYNNLNSPGIFKFLGLTANSYVMQRNDYDYSYYKLDSPSQISSSLSERPDISKVKTFGKIDLYKIKPSEVNSLFYSPKNLVATDDINQFSTIADQNNKSLSIILTNTVHTRDKYTLPNSNYYQPIFTNSTTANNRNASFTVDVPHAGSYQLANVTTNTNYQLAYSSQNGNFILKMTRPISSINVKKQQITPSSNDVITVDLGSHADNTLALEIQNHAYLLKNNISNENLGDLSMTSGDSSLTLYSTSNHGTNVVNNGSLENGLWRSQVIDCSKTTPNALIGMKLAKNGASDGLNYLELSAQQDSACTYTPALNNFGGGTYLFSIDVKKVKGSDPSYCVWDGKSCVEYSQMSASNNWSTYSNAVYLSPQATNFFLYLYAQKANYIASTDDYDNIQIYHLTSSIAKINYNLPAINSTPQKVQLFSGKQIFTTGLNLGSANLIDNPNFSAGPWQSSIQNCSDQTGTNGIGMKVVNDPRRGSALDMYTNGLSTACTNSAYISSYQRTTTYLASIDYKVVSGKVAKVCIWNGSSCVLSKTLQTHDHLWHTAYGIVAPDSSLQPLSFYLYVPDGSVGEVEYSNVSFREIENSFVNSYLLTNTNSQSINSASKINFTQVSPVQYNLNFTSSKSQPTLLAFSQSYHPAWKAYIVKSVPNNTIQKILWNLGIWRRHAINDSQHIVTNGFANGWWVDPAQIPASWKNGQGQYKLIVNYMPQTMVYWGLIVAALAFITSCLCLFHLRGIKHKKLSRYYVKTK